MPNTPIAYVFTFSFSLLVACFSAAAISALAVWLTHRRINTFFKHPFLEHRAFHQYPLAIQASIMLDYFLRIVFPRSTWSLLGHANRMLKHIDPRDIPLSVKWPVVGLWGGCFVGLLAMVVVWTSMLIAA